MRRWHLLDNGAQLARRGLTPAGTLLCVHGNPTWSYLWRAPAGRRIRPAHPWRVVAVDQLDMGFSERTGTPARLAAGSTTSATSPPRSGWTARSSPSATTGAA